MWAVPGLNHRSMASSSAGRKTRADEPVGVEPRLFCEVSGARSSGKGVRRGWEIQAVRDFPRNGGVRPICPMSASSNKRSVVVILGDGCEPKLLA